VFEFKRIFYFLRNKESAYKPGSVEDNYSSAARVTAGVKRPTRIQCEQH